MKEEGKGTLGRENYVATVKACLWTELEVFTEMVFPKDKA